MRAGFPNPQSLARTTGNHAKLMLTVEPILSALKLSGVIKRLELEAKQEAVNLPNFAKALEHGHGDPTNSWFFALRHRKTLVQLWHHSMELLPLMKL